MSKHTQEPWHLEDQGCPKLAGCHEFEIRNAAGRYVATVDCSASTENAANAARIVACVNACEGINPAAVPDMLRAARYALEVLRSIDRTVVEAPGYVEMAEDGLRAAFAKAEGMVQ